MFWKRIVVSGQARVLIARNGRFQGILGPGQHRLFVPPGVSLNIEEHCVGDVVFRSMWTDYLMRERPDLIDRYFTRVETNEMQVATIYVNEELFKVLLPSKRMLFWRGSAEVRAEVVDVLAESEIQADEPLDLSAIGLD